MKKCKFQSSLRRRPQLNDDGVNKLFFKLADLLESHFKKATGLSTLNIDKICLSAEEYVIIPADRQNYLAEIVSTVHKYKSAPRFSLKKPRSSED